MKIFSLLCGLLLALILPAQTFYREYGNSLVHEGGSAIVASADGNMFVGGYKNDSAMVTKMDLLGNPIWVRAFKPVSSGPNYIFEMQMTPDGYLVGIGNCIVPPGYIRDGFFFKMDMNGNLLWLNRVVDSRNIAVEMLETKTTSEYLVGANLSDSPNGLYSDVILYRVDAATGSVIATTPRHNYIMANPYIDDVYASAMNPAGTRLYTTGRIYINGSASTGMRPYVSKFDANGTHLSTSYTGWSSAQSARIYGSDIIYNNDSLTLCYWGDPVSNSNNASVGLIRTDTSGNVAWSKNYNISGSTSEISTKVLVTPTGYAIVGYTTGTSNDFFVISVSNSGVVLWAKSYGGVSTPETFQHATTPNAEVLNGNIYLTGQSLVGGKRNLIVASLDMAGNMGCMTSVTLTVTTTNNPTNRTPLTLGQITENLIFTPGATLSTQPLANTCGANPVDLGNDTAVCGSYTLNATVASATSYLWSTGATTPTISVNGSGTYWVVVRLNCCLFSDTIVINSGPPPSAAFSATMADCFGTLSFSNTSTGSTTYSWDFGDSNSSSASNPMHTYSSTGTYTVTLIAGNACGTDTIVQPVNVQPQPVASITGASSICEGQSVVLTASGGSSVIWSGGSTATTSVITVSPSVTTTYYATVSNGLCSSDPDTFVVTVDTLPLALISGPNTICAGQNITLTASGGSSYQWSGGSSATTPSVNVAPTVTTTYYVTTSDGICSSLPDTFVVSVTPAQNVTIVGPTTLCLGQSVTLTATGAASYQWSGGSNATTSAITVSPNSTTVYYASPGVSSCPGSPDTLVLSVVPTPILNVSGNTTICAGQSTTLTATGGSSYQWSGGATDTTASITVSPLATTTYFVTTSNGICSSPYDTITVVVTPSPTASIVGPTMICPGATVTLTAVGNASTYVWSGGASGTGPTITVSPSSPTNYFLVGYNNLGCSDTDIVNIGIYDALNAAILGDDTICAGESTALSCAGNGTFAWGPPTGLNTTSGNMVTASPAATITYSVTFTDVNGCISTDSVQIHVDACVSIEEQDVNATPLVIQPNPASDYVTFHLSSGESMIWMYNALGQLVFSERVTADSEETHRVNVEMFSEGTYTIVVVHDEKSAQEKLIIAR